MRPQWRVTILIKIFLWGVEIIFIWGPDCFSVKKVFFGSVNLSFLKKGWDLFWIKNLQYRFLICLLTSVELLLFLEHMNARSQLLQSDIEADLRYIQHGIIFEGNGWGNQLCVLWSSVLLWRSQDENCISDHIELWRSRQHHKVYPVSYWTNGDVFYDTVLAPPRPVWRKLFPPDETSGGYP